MEIYALRREATDYLPESLLMQQDSPKTTIIFGLVAATIGVFYILLAGGILGPIAKQPDQGAPAWLV